VRDGRKATISEAPTTQAPPISDGLGGANTSDGSGLKNGDTVTYSASGPDASGEAAPALATLHYVGRFDRRDPTGPRFNWPGAEIRTRFSGTAATIHLADSGGDRFWVSVDGAAPSALTAAAGLNGYVIARDLADGEHDVVVSKRTEASVGMAQFIDLVSAENRPLVPTAEPFRRKIEFVGDSITCGYGTRPTDGTTDGTCPFSAESEDETTTYAALAATVLRAARTVIAWSGIGVYRDFEGSTTEQMPVRWRRTLADDPTSEWDFSVVPDVVIVNLGTNDFHAGDPGTPFESAYATFLAAIRDEYSSAAIIATLSPMLTDSYPAGATSRTTARARIQSVVRARNAAGDARVSYFEFDEQQASDGYACDFHPSMTTHQKMSAKLVPVIQSLTGW
jgi:lysophospholipase L1-like esterase